MQFFLFILLFQLQLSMILSGLKFQILFQGSGPIQSFFPISGKAHPLGLPPSGQVPQKHLRFQLGFYSPTCSNLQQQQKRQSEKRAAATGKCVCEALQTRYSLFIRQPMGAIGSWTAAEPTAQRGEKPSSSIVLRCHFPSAGRKVLFRNGFLSVELWKKSQLKSRKK